MPAAWRGNDSETLPSLYRDVYNDEKGENVIIQIHDQGGGIKEDFDLESLFQFGQRDTVWDRMDEQQTYSRKWQKDSQQPHNWINDLLVGLFRGIGIKLVDFKIEYGIIWNKEIEKKEIVLADEISPDTCRLWDSKTEKKLDKDRFRKDLGNIIQGYQEVARRLGIMPEETNISEVNFGKTIPIKFKKK